MYCCLKSTVSDLEDEIRIMQGLISESKSSLDAVKAEETECEETLRAISDKKQLTEDYTSLRPSAQASQKNYLSLKGLHSWSPMSVGESRISFVSIGSSRNTSNTLSYELGKSGTIESMVSLEASISFAMKKSLRKYHGSISSFLDAYVERVAHTVNRDKLDSASQIGQHMQKYMLAMGRLDQTASELQSLKRRYRAKLSRSGPQTFIFTVDFEGRASKLAVDFELELSYPSLPLEVRMDVLQGSVDFESLRKMLVKNAKPGFGNLSRACDIISAFVQ
jgi:hypothetical protein